MSGGIEKLNHPREKGDVSELPELPELDISLAADARTNVEGAHRPGFTAQAPLAPPLDLTGVVGDRPYSTTIAAQDGHKLRYSQEDRGGGPGIDTIRNDLIRPNGVTENQSTYVAGARATTELFESNLDEDAFLESEVLKTNSGEISKRYRLDLNDDDALGGGDLLAFESEGAVTAGIDANGDVDLSPDEQLPPLQAAKAVLSAYETTSGEQVTPTSLAQLAQRSDAVGWAARLTLEASSGRPNTDAARRQERDRAQDAVIALLK